MRSSTLGSSDLAIGSVAIAGEPCVIVDLVGKGGRLRTVPVPTWCKSLIDVWLRGSRVTEGKLFRRVSKDGPRQDAGVTTDVVSYAVKRYVKRIGFDLLAPHDLSRTCARLCRSAGGELEQIQFLLGHASVQTTEQDMGFRQNFRNAVNDRFPISLRTMHLRNLGLPRDNPVYHMADSDQGARRSWQLACSCR